MLVMINIIVDMKLQFQKIIAQPLHISVPIAHQKRRMLGQNRLVHILSVNIRRPQRCKVRIPHHRDRHKPVAAGKRKII